MPPWQRISRVACSVSACKFCGNQGYDPRKC